MEQQSNNNIDALFQKAAEEYPLKTDNHDWNKVAANLHNTSFVNLQTKKQGKWQYAALLLFLLAGGFFIVNNFYKKQNNNSINKTGVLTKKNGNENNRQNNQLEKTNKKGNQDYLLNQTNKNALAQALNNQALNNQALNNQGLNNNKIQHNGTTLPNDVQLINESYSNNQIPISSDNNQLSNQVQSGLPLPPLNSDNKVNQSDKINKPATSTDKNIVQNSNQATKADTKENVHFNSKPQPKTFYGTFFFSPDFSTIKFQHINKPGYAIGIALGYRVNNRLSAEIGLERLHTNFYSDGKYFDKSNLKLKPTTIIDAVNGNNKLTEVPVSLKYNILKNSDKLFVSGGTTLALITHNEKYNYNVTKDGSPDNISKNFNALTNTKYFSTINLSIGYQASISDAFKIKIEPYSQIPVKGLGIGNLPIGNFGVNIGIIRDLK